MFGVAVGRVELTPLPPLPADRHELEAAQKFLEQAAIENLVSVAVLVCHRAERSCRQLEPGTRAHTLSASISVSWMSIHLRCQWVNVAGSLIDWSLKGHVLSNGTGQTAPALPLCAGGEKTTFPSGNHIT